MWEGRIRRAEMLEAAWPFAVEVLRFYRAITAFQRDVYGNLCNHQSLITNHTFSVFPALLLPYVPSLLDLVTRNGPPALAERARGLSGLGPEGWRGLLEEGLAVESARGPGSGVQGQRNSLDLGLGTLDPAVWTLDLFFPRVLLQAAMAVSGSIASGSGSGSGGGCPRCGHPPVVGVLREDREAQAVVRTLVCSLCAGEWAYPRVACPACGEEDPERLPRYTAEEIPWVRVEGCDACGRYLKAVDVTKAPEAEPVTDEIGSTPLDVLARERGYAKIAVNMMGI
jgi:hypothetical protein